jgi:hypothetical protein
MTIIGVIGRLALSAGLFYVATVLWNVHDHATPPALAGRTSVETPPPADPLASFRATWAAHSREAVTAGAGLVSGALVCTSFEAVRLIVPASRGIQHGRIVAGQLAHRGA